jgi:hypothetical protein
MRTRLVGAGGRAATTRATAAEVLAAKLGVPAKLAVRLWVVPAESVLVVNDATPFERAAVPIVVVPSRKVMLPEGTPAAEEVVAVSMTAAPAAAGFGVAMRIRLVGVGDGAATTRATAAEVLASAPVLPA